MNYDYNYKKLFLNKIILITNKSFLLYGSTIKVGLADLALTTTSIN